MPRRTERAQRSALSAGRTYYPLAMAGSETMRLATPCALLLQRGERWGGAGTVKATSEIVVWTPKLCMHVCVCVGCVGAA